MMSTPRGLRLRATGSDFRPEPCTCAWWIPAWAANDRALAVQSAGRFLVGPDNGLLSPALLLPDARCVALPVAHAVSATFHGRDVFAPAAALLATGTPLETLGIPFHEPVILRTAEAIRDAHGDIHGLVIGIDRFGNVLTNLVTRRAGHVSYGTLSLPIVRTYADVAPGTLTALVGSTGFIELAIRDGRASDRLSARRGDPVILVGRRVMTRMHRLSVLCLAVAP